ncbi:D-erythronate dehydrogenase [Piscinibacter sp. XHJ-5]|uniref:D-erythronate dehydrogenase n=1 Tax=Piscinibacter sp. XHJ-5 TaxID=3037797 RepID=UPI00245343E7|nr:D-erythronate dehydrogenase [Piscinibacter sp. XHJ-5]
MNLLITGGAGFVGARLARTLLSRGTLNGRPINRVMLADQVPPPADLAADPRVQAQTGDLLSMCDSLAAEPLDIVFHLASAVSGECEADFGLGLRSNLDTTRALLDALRRRTEVGTPPVRLVYSSSVAVFGPDPAVTMPAVVADDTLPTPQTSYGTQKLVCEHLVADYTRKGYLDGRAVRLMTVTVRPGKPNAAASSFFSGIVREPLAGLPAVCPVAPDTAHPVSSPARTVEGLIAVAEASREAFGGRTAMNLPALNVTVAGMLDALEAVAGPAVRARVRFERDARIAGIVAGWPRAASAVRASRLGLQPDPDFATIVRQYIADCEAAPDGARALQGLPR